MNIVSILEQGLIFSIAAMGVSISYKILDFPDLSTDGTFPLGAAVVATALKGGISPMISLLIGMIAGGIFGGITGVIHTKLNVTNLLSGIIVMIGLYSVNLRIMGRANVPLFQMGSLFGRTNSLFVIGTIVIIVLLAMTIIIKSKFGFVLRATGENEKMVCSLGLDANRYKVLGLCISNSLIALSGGIMAQYQGFADIGMGTGILVSTLASIILGEQVFRVIKGDRLFLKGVLGSILYKGIIAGALALGLQAGDLKLVTAAILLFILVSGRIKFLEPLRNLKLKVGEEM